MKLKLFNFLACLPLMLLISSFVKTPTAYSSFCPPCPPCYSQRGSWPNCRCGWDCGSGYCCNGFCCPSGTLCCKYSCCDPNQCETCDGQGNCLPCGGDPSKTCCDKQCSSSCYKIINVPASVEPPSCPDCAHFFSGCGDATQTVINGYGEWETAGPEECGFTKNPTKTDIVGYIFPCEEDWDCGQIIRCVAEGTICAELCANACKSKLAAAACAACLVIAALDCASDGGVCVFVTDCLPSQEGAIPITREVIDLEGDFGCICCIHSG